MKQNISVFHKTDVLQVLNGSLKALHPRETWYIYSTSVIYTLDEGGFIKFSNQPSP